MSAYLKSATGILVVVRYVRDSYLGLGACLRGVWGWLGLGGLVGFA